MFGYLKKFLVPGTVFFLVVSLQSQSLTQLSAIKTNGSIFAVKVQGDYLYFVDFRGSSSMFKTADVSDPTNPAVLDSFFTAGLIADFDVNGDFAYLAMADNEFGLRILDISDPTDIAEISFLQGGEKFGTFFQDSTLYLADGGGLSVFDATRPDTLVFDWFFNSNNFGDGIDAFVFADRVYLPVNNTGLFIIDKTTHTLLSTVPSPAPSIGVAAKQDVAFFTDDALGLVAVNVANARNPVPVDTLAGNGNFGGDVVLQGSHAFFCDGQNGLRVIDVSEPTHLNETTSFVTGNIFAIRVARQDSIIYLASGDLDAGTNFFNGIFLLKNDFSTAVRGEDVLPPKKFVLRQNFPNPFNPSTSINFRLRKRSKMALRIYDVTGQEVRKLADRFFSAGVHAMVWDGKDNLGRSAASGVYFYQLTDHENNVQSKRMLLLK